MQYTFEYGGKWNFILFKIFCHQNKKILEAQFNYGIVEKIKAKVGFLNPIML